MSLIPDTQSIYLVLGYTDMRKSIDSLSIRISAINFVDLFDGSMFVFCNKKKTIVKVLYYDRNGFCLFQKRLEKIRFDWPNGKNDIKKLKIRELRWLLDGLILSDINTSGDGEYSTSI